jgi:hypothetical protein
MRDHDATLPQNFEKLVVGHALWQQRDSGRQAGLRGARRFKQRPNVGARRGGRRIHWSRFFGVFEGKNVCQSSACHGTGDLRGGRRESLRPFDHDDL